VRTNELRGQERHGRIIWPTNLRLRKPRKHRLTTMPSRQRLTSGHHHTARARPGKNCRTFLSGSGSGPAGTGRGSRP
jgi:hypothetical protein